ncbi:MAG: formate/nitrite transporter family protein [Maricaulaceae bacterium]
MPQNEAPTDLDHTERKTVETRQRPRAAVILEIVRKEGQEELARKFGPLWWSGLAAGLSAGFSMVAAGLMTAALPPGDWTRPLIAIGYTAGFLIVILGRQQLFTENTITALIPVLSRRHWADFKAIARLWAIVLSANLVGAAIFALVVAQGGLFGEAPLAAFRDIGSHLVEVGPARNFAGGIAAGWLIAALVWILPSAPENRFLVVFFMTWLIGLGEFAHIIVGSVEVFFSLFSGDSSLIEIALRFMGPALAGNIIGGSAVFTLITYAQIREEMDHLA